MSGILGLSGNARVGKDTAADYLAKERGFVRVGLADPLKRFCKVVYDFSDDQLWGDGRDEPDIRYPRSSNALANPPRIMEELRIVRPKVSTDEWNMLAVKHFLTARYALQTLGTEWGRNCYNDTWIDLGIRTAEKLLGGYYKYTPQGGLEFDRNAEDVAGVVFSDLRFKNEFAAVKKAGKLVRIYREGHEGKTLAGVQGHASEEEQREVPDEYFDFILFNPPGLAYYWSAIDEMMAKLNA